MIRLIAAIDRKRGLAKGGVLPWYIPEDEKYYDEQTRSHGGNVLMGSTTFKTIQKPMPDRQNFILTRDKTPIDRAELIHDLNSFLKDFQGKELWVIGGANVFAQVIEAGKADELYLTHIDADFGCDQFFPEYEKDFRLVEKGEPRHQNGFSFYYAKYVLL
ncbi:MAG TPA: dihydrofolate reductase [Candidatus Saccharimonadales bacterium]|nr:dihydrofolate reductase [Candidatus Saccharimonadales bacterium]